MIFGIIIIFFVGGAGSLFIEQRILPKLSNYEWAKKLPLVMGIQERTTIIERTEKVYVTENDAIRELITQLRRSIVLVLTETPDGTKKSSGVFVTSDGIIALAADIDENTDIKVFFATGEFVDAEYVGVDAITNIKFVRIKKNGDYPAVSFTRTEDLFVGQKLLEIGVDERVYNHIYAHSTQMSAFIAEVDKGSSDTWQGVIDVQTMTARNQGALLVTDRGELAAISVYTKGKEVVLPAGAVAFALQRLVDGRMSQENDIGIRYHSVTPIDLAEDAVGHGVVVDEIIADSSAGRSRLKIGDHIVKVGSEDISAYRTLPMVLDQWKDAEIIELTVLRGNSEIIIPIERGAESKNI